jgi:hypothetical protein
VANKAGRIFTLESAIDAACMEQQALETSISLSASRTKVEPVIAATSVSRATPDRNTAPLRTCNWCGLANHRRSQCPAQGQLCRKCGKRDHFARVCRSAAMNTSSAVTDSAVVDSDSSISVVKHGQHSQRRFVNGLLRGHSIPFLLDSGSDISLIRLDLAKQLHLSYKPIRRQAVSANGDLVKIIGVTQERVQ